MTALWRRLRNGPRADLIELARDLAASRAREAAAVERCAWYAAALAPSAGDECPGRPRVTQRDLDDAVAALIRDARQEFRRGGAR